MQAELKSLQEDGVQEDELRRAKDKLVSRTVLDGDSAFSRMQDLAYTWVAKERVALAGGRGGAHRGGDAGRCAPRARPLPRHAQSHVFTAYGPLEATAFDAPKN